MVQTLTNLYGGTSCYAVDYTGIGPGHQTPQPIQTEKNSVLSDYFRLWPHPTPLPLSTPRLRLVAHQLFLIQWLLALLPPLMLLLLLLLLHHCLFPCSSGTVVCRSLFRTPWSCFDRHARTLVCSFDNRYLVCLSARTTHDEPPMSSIRAVAVCFPPDLADWCCRERFCMKKKKKVRLVDDWRCWNVVSLTLHQSALICHLDLGFGSSPFDCQRTCTAFLDLRIIFLCV